ncbi:MAG: prepilin-type N-terminal cleavage/methylation domain-containing protein [Gemmatimonadota bacterium]
MTQTTRRDGFTLIELLMVLVIIGILAAVGVNRFWAAKDRSYRAVMQNDLRNLATHQEAYYGLHQTYAADAAELRNFSTSPGVTATVVDASAGGYAARATHVSLADDANCGVYTGDADPADGAPATSPGVIACQ